MKVKFPVLINGVHQFNKFVDFLNEHGVRWVNRDIPTYYNEFCKHNSNVEFPLYVFYNSSREGNNRLSYGRRRWLINEYGNRAEEYIARHTVEVEF